MEVSLKKSIIDIKLVHFQPFLIATTTRLPIVVILTTSNFFLEKFMPVFWVKSLTTKRVLYLSILLSVWCLTLKIYLQLMAFLPTGKGTNSQVLLASRAVNSLDIACFHSRTEKLPHNWIVKQDEVVIKLEKWHYIRLVMDKNDWLEYKEK